MCPLPLAANDDGMVTYAFLHGEYAFVGIAEDVLDNDMCYPSGLFLVCSIHSLNL